MALAKTLDISSMIQKSSASDQATVLAKASDISNVVHKSIESLQELGQSCGHISLLLCFLATSLSSE